MWHPFNHIVKDIVEQYFTSTIYVVVVLIKQHFTTNRLENSKAILFSRCLSYNVQILTNALHWYSD